MRSKPIASVCALVAVLSIATPAATQDGNPNCPPGSWFCEDSNVTIAPGNPTPALPPPAPPPPAVVPAGAQPPPATTVIVPGARGTPPVIIYQQAPPPPPPAYVVQRPVRLIMPPPPPPPRPQFRHWGINLRLEAAMMDSRQSQGAGMGGAGMSFRARPVPHFALDFGLDFIGGRDYLGNRRDEVPFTVNAIVYANPRNPVQFYMLGGLGWSTASVRYDNTTSPSTGSYGTEQYSYFGGQLGAGLEFRITQPVSLNLDLIGFIRGRTDSNAHLHPEFVDSQGRTTNTSGGGLLRGGITFYW